MAKVLCVLYDDPVKGYPPDYARGEVPAIEGYHDGQTTPSPEGLGFTPVSCWAACPGSWGFGRSSRRAATASS